MKGFSESNEHFKFIDSLCHKSFYPHSFIVKIDTSNYLIVQKDYETWQDLTNFSIFNIADKSISYIDSNIYNTFFPSWKLALFSGIKLDNKILLNGIRDSSLVVFECDNGVWGNWSEKNISLPNDSTKYSSRAKIKSNPFNNDNLYIYSYVFAGGKNPHINFYLSTDKGNSWSLSDIHIPLGFVNGDYQIVSEDFIYAASRYDLYRIDFKKHTVDTVKVIPEVPERDYWISNIIFKDIENGILEVSHRDKNVNGELKKLFEYYKTTDGGYTWEKTSEINLRFFGIGKNFFYYQNNNELKGFSDSPELISTEDYTDSWSIETFNSKKPYPFIIKDYCPVIEGKQYLVVAFNGLWEFNVDITSVDDIANSDNSLIYPNPATDFITVDLGNYILQGMGEGHTISIFDVLGEKVMTIETRSNESLQNFDVSSLPPGVYFVRIGDVVQKFVKL